MKNILAGRPTKTIQNVAYLLADASQDFCKITAEKPKNFAEQTEQKRHDLLSGGTAQCGRINLYFSNGWAAVGVAFATNGLLTSDGRGG